MTGDRLVVLDDTQEVAELIGELARIAGFDAQVCWEVDSFHEILEKETPSVVVLDLQMPNVDGVEMLRRLASAGCKARILLVSGADRRTVQSAERYGNKLGLAMLGIEQKPFEPETLIARFRDARALTAELTADDLENAMQATNLVLRYQPVIRRIGSGKWHADSVEALPRWQHQNLGLLSPAEFLPLLGAGRSSLMRRFTDFVLEHGAAQLQQWQRSGLHMGLRVNVPAAFLGDAAVPDRLEQLFGEFESDLDLLTLELGDSAALLGTADDIEILTRLRLKGVRLALDDFGDAGTALAGVTSLPVSEVKLDPSIVQPVSADAGARVLCDGLIRTLHELDIECCAEGIETSEQLDALDAMGVDLVQGYYLGTPMPASEIPKAVSNWTADVHVSKTGN